MKSKRIGFIGLGQMGRGMAVNLLRRSFDLTIFDIRPEPVKELEEMGARAADSPKALAGTSDYIITMLRDTAQTRQVIFDKDGLWEGMIDGTTLLITSTIDPQFVREVGQKAGERHIAVLDAPVSRGIEQAEEGTLSIMVGGEEATFRECKPLLEAIGKDLFYMGSTGCGMVTKLVNNAIWYTNMFSMLEGLKLGDKAGISHQRLIEVIRASSGGSWVAERWDAYKNSAFKNIDKDISLALALARSTDVKLPVLELTSQLRLRNDM